jgi:hypothetical protein
MTADELRMIGRYVVRSETAASQRSAFIATDFIIYSAENTPVWRLTLDDGRVSEIDHP